MNSCSVRILQYCVHISAVQMHSTAEVVFGLDKLCHYDLRVFMTISLFMSTWLLGAIPGQLD